MARTTIEELRTNRLAAMSAEERAMFDVTYEAGRLALDVGDKVRDAREHAVSASASSLHAWTLARPLSPGSRPAMLAPPSRHSRRSSQRSTCGSSSSCQLQAAGASPTLEKCRRVAGE